MKKKELIKLITELRDFIQTEKDAHDTEYGPEYGSEYSANIIKATSAIIEYDREKEK